MDTQDRREESVAVSDEQPSVGYPRKRARTRRLLMTAGMSEISDHGAAAISVGGVARRAKVANGTFYNHFSDLDELREAIVDDLAAAVEIGHEQSAAIDNDAAMRVAFGCRQLLTLARDEPEIASAFVRLIATVPELRSRVRSTVSLALLDGFSSGRFRNAAAGASAGPTPDPSMRLVADALIGTVINWMRTVIAHEEDRSVGEKDYIIHALLGVGLPVAEITSVMERLDAFDAGLLGARR